MYIQTVPLNRSSYRILWSIQQQQVTEKKKTLSCMLFTVLSLTTKGKPWGEHL